MKLNANMFATILLFVFSLNAIVMASDLSSTPDCSIVALNVTYDIVFVIDYSNASDASDIKNVLTQIIAGPSGVINAFQPYNFNARIGLVIASKFPQLTIPLNACASPTACDNMFVLQATELMLDPAEPDFDTALNIVHDFAHKGTFGWRKEAQGHIVVIVASNAFASQQWDGIHSAVSSIQSFNSKTSIMGIAIGADAELMRQMSMLSTPGLVGSVQSGNYTSCPWCVQAIVSDACDNI